MTAQEIAALKITSYQLAQREFDLNTSFSLFGSSKSNPINIDKRAKEIYDWLRKID